MYNKFTNPEVLIVSTIINKSYASKYNCTVIFSKLTATYIKLTSNSILISHSKFYSGGITAVFS